MTRRHDDSQYLQFAVMTLVMSSVSFWNDIFGEPAAVKQIEIDRVSVIPAVPKRQVD